MKNTHGGPLCSNFTKNNRTPWVFFPFLNCENDTKSCKASFNIFVWRLPSELKYHYIIISTKVRHNIIQLFMLLYVFKLLFYFKNYLKFVLLISL